MFRHLVYLPLVALLIACSDFLSPVETTPAPSEYEYNYWLLQKTYLYEKELAALPPEGDSVQALYGMLEDRYTRYTEPVQSAAVIESRNTSIVTGDIGLEFLLDVSYEHPLFIRHVYPKSPAANAGVPKNGNLISINGVELTGSDAYTTYKSVFDTTAEISLEIALDSTIKTYDMRRETIYAPTIFVDTIGGYTVINIREFKPNTLDQEHGTYGELRDYLDSTTNDKSVRIIDIRNNPGGHVDQCIRMADLFVKEGTLSSRNWYTFAPDGKRTKHTQSNEATSGDPGEKTKFIMLANTSSASCAEIFAAAVHELADIPLAGTRTYGKGIGQAAWKTPEGGLATITTLEFFTPKGNSYHKKGVEPEYTCENGATIQCAIEAAESHFGKALQKKASPVVDEPQIIRNYTVESEPAGGAFVDNNLFW